MDTGEKKEKEEEGGPEKVQRREEPLSVAMQGAPAWALALFKELASMNTTLTGHQQEQQQNLQTMTAALGRLEDKNKMLEERVEKIQEDK
eukprot:11100396-Prorocentrum_lima.AAC.1